jgi:hypothetical protein
MSISKSGPKAILNKLAEKLPRTQPGDGKNPRATPDLIHSVAVKSMPV